MLLEARRRKMIEQTKKERFLLVLFSSIEFNLTYFMEPSKRTLSLICSLGFDRLSNLQDCTSYIDVGVSSTRTAKYFFVLLHGF